MKNVVDDEFNKANELESKTLLESTEKQSGFWAFIKRGNPVGICVNIAYLLTCVITKFVLEGSSIEIDMSSNGLKLFSVYVSLVLCGMGILVAPLGIIANLVSVWIKTKLLSFFNTVILAITILLIVGCTLPVICGW